MKPLQTGVLSIVIALTTVASALAADGVLMVQRITTGTNVTTTEVQIEKTRMRTEITDPSGDKQVVIFDGGRQVLMMVNPARKTYTEMTKADMDAMAGQMQGLMAGMQAQMANLPPAQRAQMEAMMKGRGMGAAPEKTEYKRTGTDQVGKWACVKYDAMRGGQKVSEICTVEPSALGFTAADFAIGQQLAEFMRAIMPQANDQVVMVGRLDQVGFSGLPIKSSTTSNGRTTTTELTDARRQVFADALFAPPAGFQKQSMPMMGGARGR